MKIRFTRRRRKEHLHKLSGSFLQINVKTLQLEDGRMIPASKYGAAPEEHEKIELTEEEVGMVEKVKVGLF